MAEGDYVTQLREQLAHDIALGDMSSSDTEETALDRIGALARTDPLGAALWRVVGNMDVGSFRYARSLLADLLHKDHVHSYEACRRVANIASEEWLACQCETCGGRKFVVAPVTGTRSKCPDCHGTGRGRHSDEKRMAALGIGNSGYSKLTDLFVRAHALLNASDARVERELSYQLERRKPLKRKA